MSYSENKIKKALRILKTEGFRPLKKKIFRSFLSSFVQPDMENFISNSHYDFNERDIADNKNVIESFLRLNNLEIKTINWFLPYSKNWPMGGRSTIYKFAKYFSEKKGVKNRFVYFYADQKEHGSIVKILNDGGVLISGEDIFILSDISDLKFLPESDASFATRWDSAFPVFKFNKTKAKFYFLQDFEPLFYPASTNYSIIESTYDFGFTGIANSPSLYEEYSKHNPRACFFIPAVDRNTYYPSEKNKNSPTRIFFYGRPGAARNGFKLGLEALKKVKKIYGDKIEIISAGENWNENDYGVRGVVNNLGLLKGLDRISDLYRKCDIGLSFVFSKGSPLITFEIMASGLSSVTNYNLANLWILKNNENCLLAQSSVSHVTDKLKLLIEDTVLREKISKNGVSAMKAIEFDDQVEKVWNFMTRPDGKNPN